MGNAWASSDRSQTLGKTWSRSMSVLYFFYYLFIHRMWLCNGLCCCIWSLTDRTSGFPMKHDGNICQHQGRSWKIFFLNPGCKVFFRHFFFPIENNCFLNSYQPVISRRNFSHGQQKWQIEVGTALSWLHKSFGATHRAAKLSTYREFSE